MGTDMPEILKVDPQSEAYAPMLPVVELLLKGGVVVGPTQTFYGIMVSADRPEAIERVLRLKDRDANKPLLLLMDRAERLTCYARELPDSAQGLVRKFWPGALTLLFRAHQGLHPALVGPTRTVALRVEGLPVIRILVRALDRAVTGTSANPGGAPPATTVEQVVDYFGDQVDMILDGGRCTGGQASTIIDCSLGPPRLIRLGALSLSAITAAAPDMRAG